MAQQTKNFDYISQNITLIVPSDDRAFENNSSNYIDNVDSTTYSKCQQIFLPQHVTTIILDSEVDKRTGKKNTACYNSNFKPKQVKVNDRPHSKYGKLIIDSETVIPPSEFKKQLTYQGDLYNALFLAPTTKQQMRIIQNGLHTFSHPAHDMSDKLLKLYISNCVRKTSPNMEVITDMILEPLDIVKSEDGTLQRRKLKLHEKVSSINANTHNSKCIQSDKRTIVQSSEGFDEVKATGTILRELLRKRKPRKQQFNYILQDKTNSDTACTNSATILKSNINDKLINTTKSICQQTMTECDTEKNDDHEYDNTINNSILEKEILFINLKKGKKIPEIESIPQEEIAQILIVVDENNYNQ